MRIPENVIIFGTHYTVILKEDLKLEGTPADGYVDLDSLLIFIDKKAKNKHLVLIHEMVHALFERLSINAVINEELEEILCDIIAKMVTENFKINLQRINRPTPLQ